MTQKCDTCGGVVSKAMKKNEINTYPDELLICENCLHKAERGLALDGCMGQPSHAKPTKSFWNWLFY
jgi:hypothetical protein